MDQLTAQRGARLVKVEYEEMQPIIISIEVRIFGCEIAKRKT